MPATTLSRDADLIGRFLDGDTAAVGEIDKWIKQASWPFRRRLGDHWDDALQDVRLEVTRLLKNSRFRGESSLKTYLWRVANNACVDRVRSQRRVSWEDLETVDQRGDKPREAAIENAFRGEARDLMLRVLAQMSEECKSLWQMIFDGLSYRQMSARLGVSEGALRVRVLRCRRRAVEARAEIERGIEPKESVTDR